MHGNNDTETQRQNNLLQVTLETELNSGLPNSYQLHDTPSRSLTMKIPPMPARPGQVWVSCALPSWTVRPGHSPAGPSWSQLLRFLLGVGEAQLLVQAGRGFLGLLV